MPGLLSRYQFPFMNPQWGMQPQPQPPIFGPMGPAPADTMQMPWGNGQPFANLYNQPQTPKQPVPKQPQPGDQASQPAFSPQTLPVDGIGLQSDGQNLGPQGPGYRKPNFIETVGQGVQDFGPLNLARLGMSMMGNAANPNGWAQVGQDLGGILQENAQDKQLTRQNKRQDTADSREAEQFKAWQAEQKNKQGLTDRYNAALKDMDAQLADPNLPSEQKAELATERKYLGMVGPEGWGQYELSLQQQKAEQERMKANQVAEDARLNKELAARAEQGALDRKAELEKADLMKRDPSATVRGRSDQARIAPWIDAANTAQVYTLPRIQRMREIMTKLAGMNGLNQPLTADQRITLSRLTGSDPVKQGLLQELTGLIGQFSRDEAQKLKPVSNLDIEGIQKNMPGADTPLAGGLRMLDRMEAELKRGVGRTNNMMDWMDQGYSLSQPNKEGKTFLQVYGEDPWANASPSAAPATPAAGTTLDQLPDASSLPDGKRIQGPGGIVYVTRGGKWTQQPSIATAGRTGQPGGYVGR